MRKNTVRLILSGLAGAVVGAVLIVAALSVIGERSEKSVRADGKDKSAVSALPAETSSAVNATPKSTASPSIFGTPTKPPELNTKQEFAKGQFRYTIPNEYRLASEIVELDARNAPQGSAILTLSKGSLEQEKEYVNLIGRLQEDRATTEAPQFLPGKTITVSVAAKSLMDADAKLARGQEKISTSQGLMGTRFIRVEGLFAYDIAYLNLPDGRLIAVQMSYGSDEPLFDEKSFLAVINSITGF